ncbi:hypothetical protein R6Z07M_017105 [Ovis aries]
MRPWAPRLQPPPALGPMVSSGPRVPTTSPCDDVAAYEGRAGPLPVLTLRPTSSPQGCSCVPRSRLTSWATLRRVVGVPSSSALAEACAPVCAGALAYRPFLSEDALQLRAGNVASLPGELGAQAASQGSVRFVPAGFEEQPDRLSASPVLLPWCGDSGLIPSECAQLLPSPPRTQQMLWWKSQEDGTGLHPPLTQTSEVSEPQACTRPAVLPVLHGSLAQSLLRCQLDRRCPRVRPSRWRPVPASRRRLVHGGMPDTRACSSCSDPAKANGSRHGLCKAGSKEAGPRGSVDSSVAVRLESYGNRLTTCETLRAF